MISLKSVMHLTRSEANCVFASGIGGPTRLARCANALAEKWKLICKTREKSVRPLVSVWTCSRSSGLMDRKPRYPPD